MLRLIRFASVLYVPLKLSCGLMPVRAALLEVQHELGGVEDPRTVMPADAEGDAVAVGVGQQRADVLGRLRVLVVEQRRSGRPSSG